MSADSGGILRVWDVKGGVEDVVQEAHDDKAREEKGEGERERQLTDLVCMHIEEGGIVCYCWK